MKRRLLLAGLIALVLLLASWLIVRRSSPSQLGGAPYELTDEDKKVFAAWLQEKIGATPATAEDWKKAKVVTGVVRSDGAELPWGFALNVLPLMEAEKNIHVANMYVGVERSRDQSLTTRLWSAVVGKAAYTVAVDWRANRIRVERALECEGLTLDQMPPGDRDEAFGGNGVDIAMPMGKRGLLEVCYSKDCQIIKRVPIVYDCGDRATPGATFISSSYPIAVLPKLGGTVSFILVDIVNFRVIGEIAAPKEAQASGPLFALDRAEDVLVAAGSDLNWIFSIDLRPYVSKIRSDRAKTGEQGAKP